MRVVTWGGTRIAVLGVAAALGVAAGNASADSVTDQIDQAKTYYQEGDLRGAVSELEFAVQEMRNQLGARYVATLPEAPSGWTAGEPSQDSAPAAMFGGGTVITREYTQTGGNGRMTATIMADSPMIQGLMGLFSNPAMLAAQPGAKRIRIEREDAVLTFDPAAGSGEINLPFGSKILVKVEGSNLTDGAPLEELIKSFRFDEIKKLADG